MYQDLETLSAMHLKSRALGYGNPMTYTTEQKLGSLQPTQVAPMGNLFLDTLGEDVYEPIVSTVKTTAIIAGCVAAGYAFLNLYPKINAIRIS